MNRMLKTLTALTLLLALGLSLCSAQAAGNYQASQYESAIVLTKAGHFDLALPLFNNIGDYEDTALYIAYIEGVLLYQKGEYEAALALLTPLAQQNFLDSANLLTQAPFAHLIPTPTPEPLPTPTPVPQPTLTPEPQPTPTPVPLPTRDPDFVEPTYYGVIRVVKSGYMNARISPSDSKTFFRVHYGERFLCTGIMDGWYEILAFSDVYGYLPSDAASTLFEDNLDQTTMSLFWNKNSFQIKTLTNAELYSQPRSSAKTRRVDSHGNSSTFYYPKNSTLTCWGSTVRDRREWYLLLVNNEGTIEMGWLRAESCELLSGDPRAFVIPAEWYD